MRGVIKTWKDERGFGFLKANHPDAAAHDIFFHVSGLASDMQCIRVGADVEFDLAEGLPRKKAVNVRVLQ